MLENIDELPTIDVFSDDRFLNGIKNYRGKLCGAGHKFVRINKNGQVVKCDSGEFLGNVLLKNLNLYNEPKPCNTSYCPYFCEKYTNN